MTKPLIDDLPKKDFSTIFRKTLTRISPVLATKIVYWIKFKRPLDLQHPRTLNEKLCWLKLNTYKDNPLVTQCADKYAVRDYVKSKGLEKMLNDLLGVWDSPDKIPWDELPNQFVLKCNHGCGFNIIVPDKSELSYSQASKALAAWMKVDYWLGYAELQYIGIPKKIICEKYLSDGTGQQPRDYKVFCFHGSAKYIFTVTGRGTPERKLYYFDLDWNLTPLTRDGKAAVGNPIPRPVVLDEMLRYAEVLAKPFPFVRVDFFVINEKLVFGEMTFTPAAGLYQKRLTNSDKLFGDLLQL